MFRFIFNNAKIGYKNPAAKQLSFVAASCGSHNMKVTQNGAPKQRGRPPLTHCANIQLCSDFLQGNRFKNHVDHLFILLSDLLMQIIPLAFYHNSWFVSTKKCLSFRSFGKDSSFFLRNSSALGSWRLERYSPFTLYGRRMLRFRSSAREAKQRSMTNGAVKLPVETKSELERVATNAEGTSIMFARL